MTTRAAIAMHRFGLGARPGDRVAGDPAAWLAAQIDAFAARPPAIVELPSSAALAGPIIAYREARRIAGRTEAGRSSPAMVRAHQDFVDATRAAYQAAVGARATVALVTDTPFAERLVHFWSNHFAVSTETREVRALAGAFEFEAIRPHVMGRFRDLLRAAEQHPAMLLYFNQVVSAGADSTLAHRRAGKPTGLNENLAREILELHTLGVRTGYDQADVTEFARALTGWSAGGVGRFTPGDPPGFVFSDALHEPGTRTIMGRSYPQRDAAQALAVLDDLARHPATARHIATKLARHFAGDAPAAMIDRLAGAFTASDGDLPTVYRALIASPEAWRPAALRFRTPWEWGIAAHRALGVRAIAGSAAAGLLDQLGQPVWRPGQPAGWDDDDAAWAAPDALIRRIEAAERLAAANPVPDAPVALAAALYPDALSAATATAIARAEAPAQGMALLLVSPEAMRR